MNILMIVTEKLPVPPIRGGAIQTYIAGVTAYLSKYHKVTILGVTDPELPNDEIRDGVRYIRIPGKVYDLYEEGVVNFLRNHSFDLIYIFNRPRLVNAVSSVAANARIMLSMHNDMFVPEKLEPEEAEAVIARVEKIVTISSYVGKKIAELYPQASDKLRTIYSGVDINRYNPDNKKEVKQVREKLRTEFKLGNRDVILFVGRLSPKKGADILVRSMYHLAKKNPKAALVLVGSKWYSDEGISDYVAYVRALAARSPIPVVTTGFVAPDQVHKWFWVGDIFVCPSQWEEPLARVHYEAMAAGLPIITTARGGNPEVIVPGQNGLIVDRPQEPQAFAEKISQLLSKPDLRRAMGENGQKLAGERYHWERVARDILEVMGT
jgi:spore coat protein SA